MNLLIHKNNRNPKRAREATVLNSAAMATQKTGGLWEEGNTQGVAYDCSEIVQGTEQGTHIEPRSLPQLRKSSLSSERLEQQEFSGKCSRAESHTRREQDLPRIPTNMQLSTEAI